MTGQTSKKHACPKCEQGELRRLNRVGFLERELLHSVGIFPWECVLCRKKSYLRDNGHKKIAHSSASGKVSTQKSTA